MSSCVVRKPRDVDDIARVMRASLSSHSWIPTLHKAEEDRAFIREQVLPRQDVTVAEAGGGIVGFIAVHDGWVDELYLSPEWTGQGIGSRLLEQATAGMRTTKLYCFQQNSGARRFYERHGFRAGAFSTGGNNEEGLPDILYVRQSDSKA